MSDMWRIIPFLFLVFCGPVLGGPQTNFHGNMTDQELFWGTDQYDFSVVVPAAGLECFWHFAHRGERFYLSFMVRPRHERNVLTHLSVTVNAPSSLIMATVDDAKGQINFETEETGFYQMCFSNFHNRFGTMQVFLSFGNHVFHMFRYYNFGRMRKSADFFLLLSNSQYVTWWSLFLSFLIVTSGYLQLLFLKRLFITKSGTEEEKPRC
ncbi:hypothetical protein F7725_023417 [Dissostichus mawsoni]|uniref:GOLD domain-containing protein n=1 Tax=Dissostichus mawsoni TaxID=36200 RepID=A0A7J5Z0N0_DISMA|nr:hypothetical protein F7725_023417 [Dissostichus mawsoni]